MIDFHCHILAATDDGAPDSAASLAIAGILARAGFSEIHCTPHMIRGAYDNSPTDIRNRVKLLQKLLRETSLQIKLSPGAEYYFDEYLPDFLIDPLPLAGRHILVESPLQTTWPVIAAQVDFIVSKGFTPLIAHPERTPLFSANLSTETGKRGILSALSVFFRQDKDAPGNGVIDHLRQKGCRFQGNLGSFAGIYGERVRTNALSLLDQGIYNCLGSDAHRHDGLEKTLKKGVAAVQSRIGTEAAAKLLRGELLR